MAKTSKIVKNNKRGEAVNQYFDRRKELLKIIKDPETSYDQKRDAQRKIAKMPRDASATRHRNRCQVTGRPRGTLRKFGMSRNTFRDLALKGELPGIKKASW
ncbi:MAG: 30S ribosomal protein S14 [Actinomycetota bacterium]|nr:30S ribosomal protein S14 [Actinomycetota bacterium]MDA3013341.1 30S ribosomal protein S14 [Actinomycetota bacterium]